MKNQSITDNSDLEILFALSTLLQVPEVDGRSSLNEAEIGFIVLYHKAIRDVVVRNWRKSGEQEEECKKFMTLLRDCSSPANGLSSGLNIMALRSGLENIIGSIVFSP